MSQRPNNSLISALGQGRTPRNLADLEQQIMIQSDPAALNAAGGELPRVTANHSQAEEYKEVSERADGGAGKSAIEKLASQFRTAGQKHVLHTRIPDWLDEALNRKILELKSNGFTRMSKEAIITDAIIRYLEVEPPAGWRLA